MRIFKRIFLLISMVIATIAMALPLSAAAFAHAATKQESSLSISPMSTPDGNWVQTVDWSISKTPSTTFLEGGGGVLYTIVVDKAGVTNTAKFTGTFCVRNGGDTATTGLSVTADLMADVGGADVTKSTLDLTSQHPGVAADGFECYSYSFDAPSGFISPGAEFDVRAFASALNFDNGLPVHETRDGALDSAPDLIVNDSITVADTFSGFVASTVHSTDALPKKFQYSRTFTCGSTRTESNVASIVETGQTSEADVRVICPESQPPVPTPVPTEGTTTTTITTFTPGLPNTGSDPNS
jgi:hypothetical protein